MISFQDRGRGETSAPPTGKSKSTPVAPSVLIVTQQQFGLDQRSNTVANETLPPATGKSRHFKPFKSGNRRDTTPNATQSATGPGPWNVQPKPDVENPDAIEAAPDTKSSSGQLQLQRNSSNNVLQNSLRRRNQEFQQPDLKRRKTRIQKSGQQITFEESENNKSTDRFQSNC